MPRPQDREIFSYNVPVVTPSSNDSKSLDSYIGELGNWLSDNKKPTDAYSWIERNLNKSGYSAYSSLYDSTYSNYMNMLLQRQNQNYNSYEANLAREFSALEAQKSRDFTAEQSATQYQRAVADLKKAGLNPYLAYSQGGAAVGSSAMASTSSASSSGLFASRKQPNEPETFLSSLVGSAIKIAGLFVAGHNQGMATKLQLARSDANDWRRAFNYAVRRKR